MSIFYLSRKHLLLEKGAKSKTSMNSSVQGYSVWLSLPFTEDEMLMVHGGKELVMLEMQNRFQIESAISIDESVSFVTYTFTIFNSIPGVWWIVRITYSTQCVLFGQKRGRGCSNIIPRSVERGCVYFLRAKTGKKGVVPRQFFVTSHLVPCTKWGWGGPLPINFRISHLVSMTPAHLVLTPLFIELLSGAKNDFGWFCVEYVSE